MNKFTLLKTKFLRLFLFSSICLMMISCKYHHQTYLFKLLTAKKTGINFQNKLTDTPRLNILNFLYYYNGAGVACGDFNNDGLLDLYFISNMNQNKFFLNEGNLKFKDVTKTAHLQGLKGWSTGVTTVDINHDGLLDIYVCQVGDKKVFEGKNQLYINKGNDKNGIPIFKEEAAKYKLDFSSYSTQAVFFDYDLDGDLDLYLMKNKSVHPSHSYGRSKLNLPNIAAGDKLLRNDNGMFTDVTLKAGIFSSETGYGLGLAISDVNNDGYPDIYVGNDFFENDYFYINQHNGTFKDKISLHPSEMGHTTHFSMGNDIADFNNDGLTDILSVDMLSEDRERYLASGIEYEYNRYKQFLKNGYQPQYLQNTLQLNNGNGDFSEIAHFAGVDATEWSWAALFADFNNDGFKDVFISNGIYGATNNMDFINFISNKEIQRSINKGLTVKEMKRLINKIPKVETANYLFKNNGNLTFSNMKGKWFKQMASFSNGAVYADLDNDGDLDLVVNNLNQKCSVYENLTNNNNLVTNNYLNVAFKGDRLNTLGIGAKVFIYSASGMQLQENEVTRGYLSAVSPTVHFGLGKLDRIDSLTVVWPLGKYQTIRNPKINRNLTVYEKNAVENYYKRKPKKRITYLKNIPNSYLKYKNIDYDSYGFMREPLIPFLNSNLGPKMAVADVNNDGLQDVYIGGSKNIGGKLFLQNKNGKFKESKQLSFEKDKIAEDSDVVFFDADNDGDKDLLVVSGGGEFESGKPLEPRLYINDGKGNFSRNKKALPYLQVNASVVKVVDFNNDGFKDIFIGSNSLAHHFGVTSSNYLLKNDGKGNFKDVTNVIAPSLKKIGLVSDATWVDLNGDSFKDLIVVGHFMPISIFMNNKGILKLQNNSSNGLKYSNGLWNTIKSADFDGDGDMDFVVGNWGKNTLLKASKNQPIKLYLNDFNNDGKIDPIITYYYKNKEVAFSTKEELTKQLPYLNNKFSSYNTFSKATLTDLFAAKKLRKAFLKKVFTLSSSYIENLGNGKFKVKPLPKEAQFSAIYTMAIDDFNNDSFKDVLLAGNIYEVNTQLSRLDASHGLLLLNNKKGFFNSPNLIDQGFKIAGPARDIKKIKIRNQKYFIVTVNKDSLGFLKKNK